MLLLISSKLQMSNSECEQTYNQIYFQVSHPKCWARSVQHVWVAQVSVPRNKEEERGVLPTMWMKEIIRAVPGCFIGHRQPKILEENSCHCVFGGRRKGGEAGREIVWTGSKRCENGGAGIFTPRVCTGDYMQRFYVTHLTASSHGGSEGSPSLAGLGLRLTQLWVYKDNGCQTSRPRTNNKAEGNNQSAPVPFWKLEWKVIRL